MDNSGIIGPLPSTHFPDSSVGAGHDIYAFTDVTLIAEGSYSCISRARRHNQWWVLKSMKGEYAQQPIFQQMLQKEYDLLIRMHHSGIDRPISIEHVENLGPCLVMECIEGVTLDQFSTDRSGRRRLALQIVETMAYVHSCQIVHRDLKPTNIMVTQNGQNVKVIDFGLADSDNYAVLKQPAGTPRYISPEQLESNDPDVRNDVYSLGIILGELRLGLPFRHVIRRCTGPIEHRYMGAGELLHAMRRAERLPMWMAFISILTVIILTIALCISVFSITTTPEQPETPVAVQQHPQDNDVQNETTSTKKTTEVASLEEATVKHNEQANPPVAPSVLPNAAPHNTTDITLKESIKDAEARVDRYVKEHHYEELLQSFKKNKFTPELYEELLKELNTFHTQVLEELNQIHTDAQKNFNLVEAREIYIAANNHYNNKYYTPLITEMTAFLKREK